MIPLDGNVNFEFFFSRLLTILLIGLSFNYCNHSRSSFYGSIDAPSSFRPAKKYSDISGLETAYTDPHSKLNFANTAEYKIIKKLPSDLVAGYLTLRRANTQLQWKRKPDIELSEKRVIKEVNSAFISSDWVIGPTFLSLLALHPKVTSFPFSNGRSIKSPLHVFLILRELYLKNEYMDIHNLDVFF